MMAYVQGLFGSGEWAFLVPIFGIIEITAGVILSMGVIWKFFGKRIKKWVESAAKEAMSDTCKKVDDIEKSLQCQRRVNVVTLGNSILDACNEALEKGYIGSQEYNQVDEMFDIYDSLDGNGAVAKKWKRVQEEVKII